MFGMSEKEIKLKTKRYIVMRKYKGADYFYTERGFADKKFADAYAELMLTQEPEYKYFLFEQSKAYGNGEDKGEDKK